MAPPAFPCLSNLRHGTEPISPDPDLLELKTAFRRDAAERRRAFAAGIDAIDAAMDLGANIYGALMERTPGIVTGFLPIADEIDPRPAMTVLADVGWRRALPVVVAKGEPLEFRAWQPGDALEDGPLRTRHPAAGAAVTPDVLLVPMLAFDGAGMRMGWGGGFYDRTIEGLRAANPAVLAIGVAYSGQGVDKVPAGPQDARLDAVATEAGMTWIRERA